MAKYTYENAPGAIVYLNGVETDNVMEADDEVGYIIVAKFDDDGYLCVVDDEIATERLEGVVTVVLSNGAA